MSTTHIVAPDQLPAATGVELTFSDIPLKTARGKTKTANPWVAALANVPDATPFNILIGADQVKATQTVIRKAVRELGRGISFQVIVANSGHPEEPGSYDDVVLKMALKPKRTVEPTAP